MSTRKTAALRWRRRYGRLIARAAVFCLGYIRYGLTQFWPLEHQIRVIMGMVKVDRHHHNAGWGPFFHRRYGVLIANTAVLGSEGFIWMWNDPSRASQPQI